MKHVLRYVRPFFGKMMLGFTFKFGGTIMDLFLPMLLSTIIDDIVPTGNRRNIYLAGLLMLVCSVLAIAGNITANRMAARVARDTTEKIRNDLFARISYLSARQLDAFTVPSLESRLTSDTYNIHQMVGMFQRLGVRAPCLLIGGVIITFLMEPVLTLVLIAVMPFIAVSVYLVTKRGIPLFNDQQVATDGMTRIVRENAQGIRIIKALGKESAERERFDGANRVLNRTEKRAALNMALSSPLMNLFLNFGLVAVIFVGAIRVNAGLSETGKIIAFTSYFTIILNAVMSVTRIFIMSSRGIASANRIGEVLDTPMDMEPDSAFDAPVPEDAPKIEFDHVTFSYNGVKSDVEDVSFTLMPGQTLGIIGPTGAGKTTLIALLMRQYDVDSGAVRIDGRDVRSMRRDEISKKFGAAFQNDFLFADTIRTNIDFGRGLSDEELLRAAEYAQASPVIEEKRSGLDFELAIKGANLSGGQKQRMILSRALAGHPEILVLDDSSSALDYATDARLRLAIREHFGGVTTNVIVAQRISSILHSDLILVMEDGHITGRGTHEELLRTCPLYREISDSQMGGALLE
ncbi:MAG: ABC transporter ATP-binding protein/permease [Clostridiales bacterium]|nr:ABC transporter ATP-binding protein/permease [Clostridiales bacterium]